MKKKLIAWACLLLISSEAQALESKTEPIHTKNWNISVYTGTAQVSLVPETISFNPMVGAKLDYDIAPLWGQTGTALSLNADYLFPSGIGSFPDVKMMSLFTEVGVTQVILEGKVGSASPWKLWGTLNAGVLWAQLQDPVGNVAPADARPVQSTMGMGLFLGASYRINRIKLQSEFGWRLYALASEPWASTEGDFIRFPKLAANGPSFKLGVGF